MNEVQFAALSDPVLCFSGGQGTKKRRSSTGGQVSLPVFCPVDLLLGPAGESRPGVSSWTRAVEGFHLFTSSTDFPPGHVITHKLQTRMHISSRSCFLLSCKLQLDCETE